jgi:hypothetical protein
LQIRYFFAVIAYRPFDGKFDGADIASCRFRLALIAEWSENVFATDSASLHVKQQTGLAPWLFCAGGLVNGTNGSGPAQRTAFVGRAEIVIPHHRKEVFNVRHGRMANSSPRSSSRISRSLKAAG